LTTPEQNKKTRLREQNKYAEIVPMFRLAREGLALASVAGFVWMVCQVASFAG
jgi:hypothetical protein